MNSVIRKSSVLLAVMAVGVCGANASLLAPGSSLTLTSEAEPMGGTAIATLSTPFVAPTFSGTLVTTVWSGDTSNPFGGLTFTYQLSNNSISPDPMDRFTLSSYAGYSTDVSYFGAGIVPNSVVRNPAGNQISYNFTGPFEGTLIQGASSALLIIQTDAAGYQDSVAGIINSSSVNAATFAPVTIPEPATAALFLVGALALAVRRKS
jgi:PEP-CTERM motif